MMVEIVPTITSSACLRVRPEYLLDMLGCQQFGCCVVLAAGIWHDETDFSQGDDNSVAGIEIGVDVNQRVNKRAPLAGRKIGL